MADRNTSKYAVSLDMVSVVRGETTLLSDVSLQVAYGEKVLIFGRNGAGKTTLLKTILGLFMPTNGTVWVLGHQVGTKAWHKKRRHVGYVHQESIHVDFPISAFEVAEIGVAETQTSMKQRKAAVLECMKRAGCHTLRHRPYAHLSGGEKQRVSLARCLSQNPQVLLLDEPTASLDPSAKQNIMQILEHLNAEMGVTILMVSHESGFIEASNWIIREIEGGKVVA